MYETDQDYDELNDDEKADAVIAAQHIWSVIHVASYINQKVLENGGYNKTIEIMERSRKCTDQVFALIEIPGKAAASRWAFFVPKPVKKITKKVLAAMGKHIRRNGGFNMCTTVALSHDISYMTELVQTYNPPPTG